MLNLDVCKGSNVLIFSCSGAADVGELSDKVTRELNKDGVGRMYCTAGLGGKIEQIVNTADKAERIIALDGCPMDCVKNILNNINLLNYKHMRVTDLGLEKGKTTITRENISIVRNRVEELMK